MIYAYWIIFVLTDKGRTQYEARQQLIKEKRSQPVRRNKSLQGLHLLFCFGVVQDLKLSSYL